MSLCIKKLRSRPQTFLRMTGLSVQDFEKVVQKCRPLWEAQVVGRKKVSGRPWGLGDLEAHLLCLLLYYRTYTTHLFLGFLFDVHETCVCRGVKRLEPLLAKVMALKKDRTLSEKDLQEMIVDCTEQPIQRPQKKQKRYYSGKKKRHTLKTEIRVSGSGRITGISKPSPGRKHDFEVYKGEKPPPRSSRVYADSGYQGLDKKHKQTEIPFKKPPKGSLNREEKEYNRALSSFRVKIENKIRELKIFNILSLPFRNFRKGYGIKMNIIAGFVNLKAGF